MNARTLLVLAVVACGPKTPVDAPAADPTATAPTAGPAMPVSLEGRLDRAAELIATSPTSEVALKQAVEILEQAKDEAPSNPVVHLNLGVAKHKLGDLDGAMSAYRAAVGIQPENGDIYSYMAQVERDRKDPAAALSQLRNGIQADGDNMTLWGALVSTLREQGKNDDAIVEAKKALAINANSPEVYNALGLAYMDNGEYTLARFVFEKGLNVATGEMAALLNTNWGWTYYLQGEKPKARYRLEEARKANPRLVPALIYLAHLYMDDHNWEDARLALEEAAKEEPDDPAIQINLGICYRGVGRVEDAKKAYERALQLEPGNPAPLFNLGVLLGDTLKDYDAAVDSFQKYIDAGGPEKTLATEYIDDVSKEKKRVEKKKKGEEEAKKREADRLERQRLAEEAAKKAAEEAAKPPSESPPEGGEPAPEGQPGTSEGGAEPGAPAEAAAGEPAPVPAPETAPAPEAAPAPTQEPAPSPAPTDEANPWGGQ